MCVPQVVKSNAFLQPRAGITRIPRTTGTTQNEITCHYPGKRDECQRHFRCLNLHHLKRKSDLKRSCNVWQLKSCIWTRVPGNTKAGSIRSIRQSDIGFAADFRGRNSKLSVWRNMRRRSPWSAAIFRSISSRLRSSGANCSTGFRRNSRSLSKYRRKLRFTRFLCIPGTPAGAAFETLIF
jgi:hypothetical protein